MYSIIILLSPLVFGSAACLNHSYALRDTQTTTTTAKYNSTSYSHYNNGTSCNCVVFRMDDLQDYWIRTAQITGMNLFLSKQIPLSLAIIMNSTGNDSLVVDKISEGSKMPNALFELAIHGWDHVNYAQWDPAGIKVVYVPRHQTEKGNYADWKFRAPTHQGI